LDAFMNKVQAWGLVTDRLRRIAALAQPRIERLSDLGPLLAFFFAGRVDVTAEQLQAAKLNDLSLRKALQLASWGFDALASWQTAGIEAVLKDVAARLDVKLRDVTRPFYVAITGSPTS